MVDIRQFWDSLKFSWLRRLCKSNAFWPNIVVKNVVKIMNNEINVADLLQLGPNMIVSLGKKMDKKFWKEIFCSVTPFMQGAIFCHPEMILTAPFWDNPTILRNNRAIKKSVFPNIAQKITTISDFYYPGSNILLTKHDLENRFDIVISENDYVELNHIIKVTLRSTGVHDNLIKNVQPSRPLLINIANYRKSGCSMYLRFLKKKVDSNKSLTIRENKWHQELQTIFGTNFWKKSYSLTAGIKFDNKLKYLQFQIVRNSLFTNYKVNKFNPHISPSCSYCLNDPNIMNPESELISHLFFSCPKVKGFWEELQAWLATLNTYLPSEERKILFGVHEEPATSVLNLIILNAKQFIWRSKFGSKSLEISLFHKFLFSKLTDLKNALIFSEKLKEFDVWNNIFNCMSVLPACTAQTVIVAPVPVPDTPTVDPTT